MPNSNNSQAPWQQEAIISHSQRLLRSFQHWLGYSLIEPNDSPIVVAQKLFEANFVVVSHGTETPPIFNYGNSKALELWQLDWDTFTKLPSYYSAEPIEQSEREQMLAQAKEQGYISNYRGVRISSTGKRFLIEDGIIWNVIDEKQLWGQAATFSSWMPID